jgi:hypothetical protein
MERRTVSVVFVRTGIRHRISHHEEDWRVAWTVCGVRTAIVAPRHRGRAVQCPDGCF